MQSVVVAVLYVLYYALCLSADAQQSAACVAGQPCEEYRPCQMNYEAFVAPLIFCTVVFTVAVVQMHWQCITAAQKRTQYVAAEVLLAATYALILVLGWDITRHLVNSAQFTVSNGVMVCAVVLLLANALTAVELSGQQEPYLSPSAIDNSTWDWRHVAERYMSRQLAKHLYLLGLEIFAVPVTALGDWLWPQQNPQDTTNVFLLLLLTVGGSIC